ncbi:hypothetical protein FB480_101885 [Agrobacterium vitis]|nr:hypothetical protein FB480_101885 [Agrobacterium vitis]
MTTSQENPAGTGHPQPRQAHTTGNPQPCEKVARETGWHPRGRKMQNHHSAASVIDARTGRATASGHAKASGQFSENHSSAFSKVPVVISDLPSASASKVAPRFKTSVETR